MVRPATQADAAAIARIYNEGIDDHLATFETEHRTPSDVEEWFDGRHPIVVVEHEGAVLGYAATSSYRPRACYDAISEFSVYVARSARGRGVGRAVMRGLIAAAEAGGITKLVSRVFVQNVASRALLASLGFREVGVHVRHGQVGNVWTDVVIVELLLAGRDGRL